MAENQPETRFKKTSHYVSKQGPKKFYNCGFPFHRKDNTSEECKEFQKLTISGKNGKYQVTLQGNQRLFQMHWKPSKTCRNVQVQSDVIAILITIILCVAKSHSDNPTKGSYVAQSDFPIVISYCYVQTSHSMYN